MRLKRWQILVVCVLIFSVIFASVAITAFSEKPVSSRPDLFVGVDIGYGDEDVVYKIADAVAGYSNLIILGSLNVTTDPPKLIRVCDYLYQKGFYFIIYVGFSATGYLPPRGQDAEFYNRTAGRWGDKFLGVYLFDELGGKQLDVDQSAKPLPIGAIPDLYIEKRNYVYVSEAYTASVIGAATVSIQWYVPPYPKLFVSDYALYWYDYVSGYDTVFAEFVGNQSRQMAIALCRGAANTLSQNVGHSTGQEWGAIITWKYHQAPFLENGTELYNDMRLAYENDAKYIVVFNSSENQTMPTPLGTLTADHLDAMKRFWDYTKANPRSSTYPADAAYVLPAGYGYGFRNDNDSMWGFWQADELTPKIWNDTNSLLAQYGSGIDIVYETRLDHEAITLPYNTLIFWNGTIIQK